VVRRMGLTAPAPGKSPGLRFGASEKNR
jgi:hypothetical protein